MPSSSAAAEDGHGIVGDGDSSSRGAGGGGLEDAVVSRPLPPLAFAPVPVETLAMLADRILVGSALSTSGFIDKCFTDQCFTHQMIFVDQCLSGQCFYRQRFTHQCRFLPTSA